MSNKDIGFIYVVQMDGHDLFKIGRSNNVPRRMSEIGVQLPFPYRLRFAHRVSHARGAERDLHEELHFYRRNGEWFELTETGVQYVQNRLLFFQTDSLTSRVLSHFYDSAYSSQNLIRLGRMLVRLGHRMERRLKARHELSVAMLAESRTVPVEDLLHAEFVG